MTMYLCLIFAHYVADFICQSDSMARGKSKSNWWLSLHVITYVAVLALPCTLLFYWMGLTHQTGLAFYQVVSPAMVGYWLVLNGALHWVTDFYTSRWSSKYFSVGDYHNGFAVVGFDQCIHYTCLFLTAKMVVG